MPSPLNDLTLTLDREGTILEIRGDATEQIVPFSNVCALFPLDISRAITSSLQEAFGTGAPRSVEISANGSSCEIRLAPFSDRCVAFFHDISKRRALEAQLAWQAERLEALHFIAVSIASGANPDAVLRNVLDCARQYLPADAARVLAFSSLGALEWNVSLGFATSLSQRVGEATIDFLNWSVPRAVPFRKTGALGAFIQPPPELSEEGFVSCLFIPLMAKGETVGILEVFNRSRADIDESGWSFLDALAGQTAIIIGDIVARKELQAINVELETAYDNIAEGWARALGFRDGETGEHTRRVADLASKMAEKMNFSAMELAQLRRGAILHDIGKIAIPDDILTKPGALNDDELKIMRRHPAIAVELLSPIPCLSLSVDIPLRHHERWNGSGYPDGLQGKKIPLAARIFAYVDVYDALTSDRPYRRAWTRENALSYIQSETGKLFDPSIASVFFKCVK